MDVFCTTSKFPNLGWNWEKNCPPLHIYCAHLWEDNFVRHIYDICDLSLGSMYHMIFKADALAFSKKARDLIVDHGDWYVGEYFSYFIIWGITTVHLLPRIVLD